MRFSPTFCIRDPELPEQYLIGRVVPNDQKAVFDVWLGKRFEGNHIVCTDRMLQGVITAPHRVALYVK